MAHTQVLERSADRRLADEAREELLSHLLRSGMTTAPLDRQRAWLAETVDYLSERYPALSASAVEGLRALAERVFRSLTRPSP
jgi:hypothetical protein